MGAVTSILSGCRLGLRSDLTDFTAHRDWPGPQSKSSDSNLCAPFIVFWLEEARIQGLRGREPEKHSSKSA